MLEVVKQHGWSDTRTEACDKGKNGIRAGISDATFNDAQIVYATRTGEADCESATRENSDKAGGKGVIEGGVSTSDDSEGDSIGDSRRVIS